MVAALASGRTSLVTEPEFERAFYRLAGFRNLGRRAVRVDILERLADLIRPALSWKIGQAERPEGAYDGSAFLVTPAMMSILGATPDDMEAILKGLGYRAEAKTAEEVETRLAELAPKAEPDAAAAVAEASEPAAASGEGEVASASAEAPVAEGVTTAVAEAPSAAPVEAEPESNAPEKAESEGEAEEPKPVLLWRPARFERRRPQRGNERQGEGKGKGAKGRGPRQRHEGGPRKGGKSGEQRGGPRQPRPERPARIDPDSPFAKLAALKDQLKK